VARVISGLRVARSFVTPTGGANVVSRELDFQLGANQGIEISSVLGYGWVHDDSPTVSDTVPVTAKATQTLHLETGTIEAIPTLAGEDADDIDTEIFYAQTHQMTALVGTTNTFGAGIALKSEPSGLVVFARPIGTARNVTHSGLNSAAGAFAELGVLIYYHYILFTDAELGFLLARRQ